MTEPTPVPWELSMFSKHDGTPILTTQDVADTVAKSCLHHDVAELWGVTVPDTNTVICYTGNGPSRDANARLIVQAVNERGLLISALDKLQRFKDYVHARLDMAGVPIDPESPHKAEGCRIGGRLDALIGRQGELREAAATFAAFLKSDRGRRMKPESLAQFVGMLTAFCWVLDEEIVGTPDYVNPIPAMLQEMRKGGA